MRAARLKAHYSEPVRLRRLANLAQYARMGQMAHSEERSVLAILERKIGVSQTTSSAWGTSPVERSATSVDGGRGRLVPIAQERADPTELAEGFIVLDDLHGGACGHGQPNELAAQRLV